MEGQECVHCKQFLYRSNFHVDLRTWFISSICNKCLESFHTTGLRLIEKDRALEALSIVKVVTDNSEVA